MFEETRLILKTGLKGRLIKDRCAPSKHVDGEQGLLPNVNTGSQQDLGVQCKALYVIKLRSWNREQVCQ